MNLREIIIHNVRSIKDATCYVSDYSMLVGENYAGKTNILMALRLFYEDGGIKYKKDSDFPKFKTDDDESWVELAFETTPDEQAGLKDEYKSKDSILRVRKYFQSDNKDLVKTSQSNIYAYEGGELSGNLFYGAKNVSQAKLGNVIYIPAVSKTDETLKLTGPSPFREMVNFVMKRAVLESATFDGLKTAFDTFNTDFKDEASKDGFSINSLIDDINSDIDQWNIRFGVSVNPIRPEDIVKNLLSHYIEDVDLGGKQINLSSFGQGLQRHLIFTLIKLSAKYAAPSSTKKKDFDPDFTLFLYEEPEAFLHPAQQESLHLSLRTLASQEPEQVLISSHSPHFVSKQIDQIEGIIRLSKINGETNSFQVKEEALNRVFDSNIGLYKRFCDCLNSDDYDDGIKQRIRTQRLRDDIPNPAEKLEEEAVRYFMWLDAERASMFFAKHVIICEGASEKIFIDFLFNEKWPEFKDRHIYLLDALGKFNIHRYITLLTELGISHSVLLDSDNDAGVHGIVNTFIDERKTALTKTIYAFDDDFETFLDIDKPSRPDLKPLNIIVKFKRGDVADENIDALKTIIDAL
ncbi:MAG: AAA family ATPase [Candidatus Thiodiazotropha endolucinida]|uniref:Recombination protein F n=1 Tax=Candidatus Thiodiazotropha endolucinida TaxID=1655433 RepID=A0A7Z0VHU0_9GAMM|nr:AAA family ATPase [Candidatus Thiodiazotropha endolucinida]ODJ85848.1 recombination protein F [Candidatus Thiodiazotropha endolucinida]